MSRMSRESEVKQWIYEWKTHGKRGQKFINATAKEQRANLESLKFDREYHGRIPTWCDIDEYERCVEMLEKASREGKNENRKPS